MQEEIKPDFIPQAVLDFFESVGVVITKGDYFEKLKTWVIYDGKSGIKIISKLNNIDDDSMISHIKTLYKENIDKERNSNQFKVKLVKQRLEQNKKE